LRQERERRTTLQTLMGDYEATIAAMIGTLSHPQRETDRRRSYMHAHTPCPALPNPLTHRQRERNRQAQPIHARTHILAQADAPVLMCERGAGAVHHTEAEKKSRDDMAKAVAAAHADTSRLTAEAADADRAMRDLRERYDNVKAIVESYKKARMCVCVCVCVGMHLRANVYDVCGRIE
jgi:hypothetical protein